ncbi:MAG: hypothetical protein AAGE86_03925 [Pseudomonadota bacterium]
MSFKVPSEAAIEAEMEQARVGRMIAIRRLQQRATLLARRGQLQREWRL